MHIKVGDYIRTKEGNIFKIIGGNIDDWDVDIDYSQLEHTEPNWLELYRYNDNYSFFNDENISKISYTYKNLIEVGDYVDGHEVYKVTPSCIFTRGGINYHKEEADIKSIVTKEQFERMRYEVK